MLGEWYLGLDSANATTAVSQHPLWPARWFIPSGTQMQMRIECSGTPDSLCWGIMAYY